MITPSAKANSLQWGASAFKQQLLRLRMTSGSTLAPDGPIRADWSVFSKALQVLRGGLPAAALELEVGKEQVTVPCRAKVERSLPLKGVVRNSSVA